MWRGLGVSMAASIRLAAALSNFQTIDHQTPPARPARSAPRHRWRTVLHGRGAGRQQSDDEQGNEALHEGRPGCSHGDVLATRLRRPRGRRVVSSEDEQLRSLRRPAAVLDFLAMAQISVAWTMPSEVWELAGGSCGDYARHRRSGKSARRLIADFLIAAHVALKRSGSGHRF